MTMFACNGHPHGEAWVEAEYDAANNVTRFHIADIDREPGMDILIAPEIIIEHIERLNDALAAIQRVRELHREASEETLSGTYCRECSLPWPCATTTALDGEQQTFTWQCQRCGSSLPSTETHCGCTALDGSHE